MAGKFRYDVVQRWEGTPLLTVEDIPFPCNTVVFSCGAILEDDGQELKIYYGVSDTSICLGTAKVNELMQFCTIGEH